MLRRRKPWRCPTAASAATCAATCEETLIGAAMRRRRGEIAGFDRVIVETSGLADPGPVAQTLYADPALARDFKLGPIVTVVDAADPGSRKALQRNRARADRGGGRRRAVEGRSRRRYVERRGRSARAQRRASTASRRSSAMSTPRRSCRSTPGKHDGSSRRPRPQQRDPQLRAALRPAGAARAAAAFPLDPGRPARRRPAASEGLRAGGGRAGGGAGGAPCVRPPAPRCASGEPALVFITNGVEKREVQALWVAMKGLS